MANKTDDPQAPSQDVSITDVTRDGDRLSIVLSIRAGDDWLYCPVYAHVTGTKLAEWSTRAPECFTAPSKTPVIPDIPQQ